ncbi:hypothetical protein PFDSM3638_05860 [Pyrococcus furiosus DSM 3638]|uniref:Uncharacterized protein n=3 Tax=Pyrococcus furiosus TaxID=2261 RepID=A0A5C0XPC7_PYRFU|nr:hypothetical protein [Pyrococcus furiosus]AAL81294.1 hypothetical protein PF1170 [Pyrococcus furiosus DSM 3638]AFN03961.1 hypothetical protein PFC_05070 [Pyrococcus furiosus COM1]QEK78823.1 hypothetical protein PFDSM3638_05860 [Pyrococcus furiosus DSM 3638]
MLKLTDIFPLEVLKILSKHNFRLVGPWREYYILKGNALMIRELPLKVTFVGKNKRIVEELKPYVKRIVYGKNKASLLIGRHWLVLEFEE